MNKEVKEEVKKKTITKTCLFYCLHPFWAKKNTLSLTHKKDRQQEKKKKNHGNNREKDWNERKNESKYGILFRRIE